MSLQLFFAFAVGLALSITAQSAPHQSAPVPVPSAPSAPQMLPNTGQQLTPTAPRGSRFESLNPGLADFPNYTAGQAVTTVTSPDQSTLLVLTSGYNLLNGTGGTTLGQQINADSNEYVFVYDITNSYPVKQQVLQVPNTYTGIAFDPSGTTFYVTGGMDDNIHIYDKGNNPASWAERSTSPIALGHKTGNGLAVPPAAAGVALTADGSKLVVANYYNDSISVLNKSSGNWNLASELDLRPGKVDPANSGVPGGDYTLWVSVRKNDTAYVSSVRSREIDVVNIAGSPSLLTRIKLKGQPNRSVLNASGSRLYVAEDQTDTVAVIDTATNQVINEFPVGAPAGLLPASTTGKTGNNTNSLALAPGGKLLFVTNGNTNNIAVVQLEGNSAGNVVGLIPTGWYPNSVSVSASGKFLYVANGKSPTGANPGNCHGGIIPGRSADVCNGTNEYDLQLIKAGLQTIPLPVGNELTAMTAQVAKNNNYNRVVAPADQATMSALHSKIQHVIYIIKENRTYDQILGDLEVGNGDPSLVEFGKANTPNFHSLARNFVTLDNFYDRSEVSMDGWPWSTSARASDTVEKQVTVNYAGRGLSYDSEGTNRNVNVGLPTQQERLAANPITPADPDILPGTADASGSDGPDGDDNKGYIWNAALRAGLSLRNYGFFIDLVRYSSAVPKAVAIPVLTDPHASNTTVAYTANTDLLPYTDPFFRGFDNNLPDYFRFKEWEREFDTTYASGSLPQLSLVRFMHDHTGSFSTAILGVNTPELQVADNDYAVGLLIQKIAKSPIYHDNTLVFVIEDDAQDGGDHVDAHRSTAFIVGPYVKQNAVVSSNYTTTDLIRTIEDVLGTGQLNLNDALSIPMADVFDLNQKAWDYNAAPSALLGGTHLPLPQSIAKNNVPKPTHDFRYWATATKGMDFSAEDRINFGQYNHILWKGLMGNKPYPEKPTGLDLRANRAELLSRYRTGMTKTASNAGKPVSGASEE